MSKIDSEKYVEFVRQVTSAPSLDYPVLSARFAALEANGANVPQLATAAMGLGAEAGEFSEIVKKIFFQGKPCLLYTSPSPRDAHESRMPSSA